MPPKKKASDTSGEVIALLKKGLILQLFAMGVPQAKIGKKLKMDLRAVNDFLKGMKKNAEK